MARVVGKNATVTFEVISTDQETEQLLQQTLTNMVGGLLKQDKDRLKAALSTSPLPKQKPTSEAPEIKYAKERLEAPELIALGGKWAYSVGLVSDETSKSMRIAKGTIKGAFYRDKQTNEMVLKPDDKMHPISEVIAAFKADLYDAYNETIQLLPFYHAGGTTAFLVNATSLSMPGSAMPYYNVTVSERGKGSFSYTFNGSFVPLLLSNGTLPGIPFRNFTAEYVDSALGLAALPLNVSLSFDSGYFLLWQYNDIGNLPFLVSQEPGHLSDNYPLLYGQNSTVYVNLEGGGVHIIGLNPGAGYSLVSLNATLESGGITRVWAIDSQGAVLANITLVPTSKGIAPSGFTGLFELLIPSTKNQTISIYTENSWGFVSDAGNLSLTVFSSERPEPSVFLIALLVMFVYAALLTSWIVQRRRNS
jgi:hypothetical protein